MIFSVLKQHRKLLMLPRIEEKSHTKLSWNPPNEALFCVETSKQTTPLPENSWCYLLKIDDWKMIHFLFKWSLFLGHVQIETGGKAPNQDFRYSHLPFVRTSERKRLVLNTESVASSAKYLYLIDISLRWSIQQNMAEKRQLCSDSSCCSWTNPKPNNAKEMMDVEIT